MQHFFFSPWLRYSESIVQFPITCLFCILLKKSIYIWKNLLCLEAQKPCVCCVCCKSRCSRSHLGCLAVCFSCLVVLECPAPCTTWKEVATDGGFSMWQRAVHLPPCHERRKICGWNPTGGGGLQSSHRADVDRCFWKTPILEMELKSVMTVIQFSSCW